MNAGHEAATGAVAGPPAPVRVRPPAIAFRGRLSRRPSAHREDETLLFDWTSHPDGALRASPEFGGERPAKGPLKAWMDDLRGAFLPLLLQEVTLIVEPRGLHSLREAPEAADAPWRAARVMELGLLEAAARRAGREDGADMTASLVLRLGEGDAPILSACAGGQAAWRGEESDRIAGLLGPWTVGLSFAVLHLRLPASSAIARLERRRALLAVLGGSGLAPEADEGDVA